MDYVTSMKEFGLARKKNWRYGDQSILSRAIMNMSVWITSDSVNQEVPVISP